MRARPRARQSRQRLGVAAPDDDRAAGRRGGVGEREAPGPGAGDADRRKLAHHAPPRRRAVLKPSPPRRRNPRALVGSSQIGRIALTRSGMRRRPGRRSEGSGDADGHFDDRLRPGGHFRRLEAAFGARDPRPDAAAARSPSARRLDRAAAPAARSFRSSPRRRRRGREPPPPRPTAGRASPRRARRSPPASTRSPPSIRPSPPTASSAARGPPMR